MSITRENRGSISVEGSNLLVCLSKELRLMSDCSPRVSLLVSVFPEFVEMNECSWKACKSISSVGGKRFVAEIDMVKTGPFGRDKASKEVEPSNTGVSRDEYLILCRVSSSRKGMGG